VIPSREEEFIAAWRERDEWMKGEVPGSHGTLLRDRDQTNRFVSFGPWVSAEAVAHFRASPGFEARAARMDELLKSYEPWVMDHIAGTP
jgi:heme-degrading monooxygenase HmoA